MSRIITEYFVYIVEPATDPVSNEICGGDQHVLSAFRSKNKAISTAKKLKDAYEIHVYQEINADIRGHWIFKGGAMTHNMFNN
jgi:hypothetical protein